MKFWHKSIYQGMDQPSHLMVISPGAKIQLRRIVLADNQLTKSHTDAMTE